MAEEPDREVGLCESCKELKPVVQTDNAGREFCAQCVDLAKEFVQANPLLAYMLVTIPYKVGDRVECRTAGVEYDGVGTVVEVSTDLEKFGTPIYPAFHVEIDEKATPDGPDECWYMESQLRRVEVDA